MSTHPSAGLVLFAEGSVGSGYNRLFNSGFIGLSPRIHVTKLFLSVFVFLFDLSALVFAWVGGFLLRFN